MDPRQLRAFIAVAEERHFSRAAERLHMSQPPLSQQIKRLERELGVQLFVRTTRNVELAPAGELLLERARAILAALDRAVDDARRAHRGESGRLAIGFTGSATYALLPRVAATVRDALPGLQLDLHGEMLTPAQVEGLVDGTLDLAILRPPVHRGDLAVEIVRTEPLIAVLPEQHRLAHAKCVPVDELAGESFVAYVSHFRSVLRDAVEQACESHGFVPNIAIEVAETSTLVSFVAAGIGVSLVPASVAHMSIAGAVYRPLAGDPPEVDLALAWRRDDDSLVLARSLDVVRRGIRSRVPAASRRI